MKFHTRSTLSVWVAALLFFGFQSSCDAGRQPESFVLQGVSFVENSAALKKGSEAALQQLLQQLLSDGSMSVEIRCHVATSGDPLQDAKLGRQRAEALRGWLMKQGVAFYRVDVAGAQTQASLSEPRPQVRQPAGDRVEIVRVEKSFPSAEVPDRAFRFDPVVEGREVLHDFRVQNKGSAPLNISKVRTG